MSKNRYKGFTLLELMIVVSIALILLGIGAPAMNRFLADLRVDSTLSRIARDLNYARNQAVNLKTQVVACVIDNNACLTEKTAWEQGLSVFISGAIDAPLYQGEQPDTSMTIKANRSQFTFRPDGLALGSNGTILICQTDGPYAKLVVSTSGRISVDDSLTSCSF